MPTNRFRRPNLIPALAAAVLVPLTLVGVTPTARAAQAGEAWRGSDARVANPIVAQIPGNLGKGIEGRVSPDVVDLPARGFTEKEFSVTGTATSYAAASPYTSDGRWTTKIAETGQPYRTRIVVRRPTDPAQFNGTVVVEWVNVTFGVDIPVEFAQASDEFLREGYAYVGVSAQQVGITKLVSYDPTRYGSLKTPGDAFSYDIFSQAGKAIRNQAAKILPGMTPHRLIAAGHSQSALRLTTYLNAIQPHDNVFDGFLIHGRPGGVVSIGEGEVTPPNTGIRTDLGVPTLQVQSETDALFAAANRQPDSASFRTWEVAGTAHGDEYLVDRLDIVNAREKVIDYGNPVTCDKPLNSMPAHYVHDAAYHALNRWIRTGKPAPKAAVIETSGPVLSRDADGNVKGGIRLPDIEVPVASYGPTNSGGTIPLACGLLGTTTPFDAAKLRSLYPTHHDYVTKYIAAAARARDAGFLLPADYADAVAAARARPIPPS
jgi:hypothetical protein